VPAAAALPAAAVAAAVAAAAPAAPAAPAAAISLAVLREQFEARPPGSAACQPAAWAAAGFQAGAGRLHWEAGRWRLC
jgi:hypothetical protein